MRLLLGLGALLAGALVGLLSGASATLLHREWWGLALALATGLVVLALAPPGPARVGFALGWCAPVLRGALPGPGGGFLVAADDRGWSLIAGSAVLLLAAVATVRSGRRAAPTRAHDPGPTASST